MTLELHDEEKVNVPVGRPKAAFDITMNNEMIQGLTLPWTSKA